MVVFPGYSCLFQYLQLTTVAKTLTWRKTKVFIQHARFYTVEGRRGFPSYTTKSRVAIRDGGIISLSLLITIRCTLLGELNNRWGDEKESEKAVRWLKAGGTHTCAAIRHLNNEGMTFTSMIFCYKIGSHYWWRCLAGVICNTTREVLKISFCLNLLYLLSANMQNKTQTFNLKDSIIRVNLTALLEKIVVDEVLNCSPYGFTHGETYQSTCTTSVHINTIW